MRRVPPIANPSADPLLPYRDASAGVYPGSWPGAEFYNSLLAEVCHVIEYAGLTLDGGDLQQLRKAIAALIAAGGGGGGSAPVSPDFRVVTGGPLTSPPGSPASGSQYLVGASATGAFAGKDYQLASWDGTAWAFATVLVGRVFRIIGTDTYYNRVSGGWASFTLPISIVAGLQAALDGKVSKAGDTMTGELLANAAVRATAASSATNPTAGASTGAGLRVTNADPTYGLNVGVRSSSGASWLQGQRFDAAGTLYDLVLNPLGGNVGIGGDPNDKLDVNGGIRGTKLRATVVGAANAVELADSVLGTQWAQYLANGYWCLYSYVAGNVGQKFAISPAGAISLQGDAGAANKVLVGGSTASWRTLSELGIGKKLIASDIVTFTANVGTTIALPAAEADALYTVKALYLVNYPPGAGDPIQTAHGACNVSKTTTNFTLTLPISPGAYTVTAFYSVFR